MPPLDILPIAPANKPVPPDSSEPDAAKLLGIDRRLEDHDTEAARPLQEPR